MKILSVIKARMLSTMIAFVAIGECVNAYDVIIDDIAYDLLSGNKARVTYRHLYQNDKYYRGNMIIPSSISNDGTTYSVEEISAEAFTGCENLTSLTIPNSIIKIGGDAFKECTALKEVVFEDGESSISLSDFIIYDSNRHEIYRSGPLFEYCPLESLQMGRMFTYDTNPFKKCTISKITLGNGYNEIPDDYFSYSNVQSFTLPNTIKRIGKKAFLNGIFSSMTLPSSIEVIDESAFSTCKNLKEISIPNSVTSINKSAFASCVSLASIKLSESLTTIGESAFSGCKVLASIDIPTSVTFIGRLAFNRCDALTIVTIPENVEKIGGGAFAECASLTGINVKDLSSWYKIDFSDNFTDVYTRYYANPLYYAKNMYVNGELLKSLELPSTTTALNDYAFYGCGSIESVVIPNSITNIGDSTFASCTNLKKVTLNTNTVKPWFKNMGFIEELVLGNTVYTIEKNAFEGCNGLKSVHAAPTLAIVGNNAFNGCTRLEGVWITDLSQWCTINWENQYANPLYNAHRLYVDNSEVKDLVIPGDIEKLKRYTFAGGEGFTSVTIPESVRIMDRYAFLNCTNLKYVDMRDMALWCTIQFDGSSNPLMYAHVLKLNGNVVSDLYVPETIEKINDFAFYGCESIVFANIPNNIKEIGYTTFGECTNLKNIISFPDEAFYLPKDAHILTSPAAVERYYQYEDVRAIVLTKTTQSTINLSSHDFFSLEGASFNGISKNAENGSVTFTGAAPNATHKINVSGKAFGRDVSGDISVSTEAMVLDIILEEATNLTVKLKGTYGGDAEVVKTDFGEYGDGDETTITGLIPGGSCYVTFNVTTSDGSVSSISKTFNTKDIGINIDKKLGSTYCILNGSYDIIDATYVNSGFAENEEDVLRLYGLDPNTSFTKTYFVNTEEGGFEMKNVSFTTEAIKFETQAAQAVSDKKAIISASVNGDDDSLRFGFEWRRYDAPDIMPSTQSPCPIHNGIIAGSLNNLSSNTYYKYRPYYKSDSGKTYYGDWIAFCTSDAYVYFEPIVYTYAPTEITFNSATLKGTVLPGSDDVTEQGFEYWPAENADTRERTESRNGASTITSEGTLMKATVENLKEDTEYRFRTYVKTSKETTYGEEMTFRTDKKEDTGLDEITAEDDSEKQITGYYNLQGMKLEKPEKGFIIVRYSDGSARKILVR